jgi:glutathione synthase
MDYLFIADPLEEFRIYKDSTFAMMEEVARRGHRLFYAQVWQLARTESGTVECGVSELTLVEGGNPWYRLTHAAPRAVNSFDAVLMRKDPPFDLEYVVSTYRASSIALAQSAATTRNLPSPSFPRCSRQLS